jgi:predicted nuclease of predicted toxin-antitoxin system
MRFLVDECTGPRVAQWLRDQGHDVFSVYDEDRGADDEAILERAVREERIVITNDKDFGELAFREQRPHRGIVLLRLASRDPASQIQVLASLLATSADQLANHFVVATESAVRIGGTG